MHPNFPVEYEKSQGFGYRDGAYHPDHDKFVFTIGQNERIQIPFETAISTLAHETRHKHQFDLMREYSAIKSGIQAGRKTAKDLENMKELELAKKFQNDWEDKEFNKLVGKYKYDKDGLEMDAFAYEKEYRQRFYKDEAPIYVGSSKKLRDRLKQHIGITSKSTYALHLNKWWKNKKIEIEIYEVIDYANTQLYEDRLWQKNKPILGREGKK